MTVRLCIHHRRLRWVWLCVLLCWAVAYATPLVRPHAMTLVCKSTGGAQWVSADPDTDTLYSSGAWRLPSLDCAQCLPSAVPPPLFDAQAVVLLPRGDLPAQATRPVFANTVAAPPARGPPAFRFSMPT